MNVDELCQEAQHLPPRQKGELISRLMNDFGRPAYDVSDDEVLRRIEETRSGTVSDISHQELLSGLQHLPNS
jgi:hypothetical protein